MGKERPNVICLDMDGTVNRDENYYLGSQDNWKSLVEFLPGVIEGINRLNHRLNTEIFILTNQSGVALDMMTEDRMHEVNRYVIESLRSEGLEIMACFACPYVDSKYAKKAESKGRKVNPIYVNDKCPDLKPNIGLVQKACQCIGRDIKDCSVYVLGDRESDVMLGLRARGHGILISSEKTRELGDYSRVKALEARYPGNVYIASDFSDAAMYVERDIRTRERLIF